MSQFTTVQDGLDKMALHTNLGSVNRTIPTEARAGVSRFTWSPGHSVWPEHVSPQTSSPGAARCTQYSNTGKAGLAGRRQWAMQPLEGSGQVRELRGQLPAL